MLSSPHDDDAAFLMGRFSGLGLAATRGGRRLFEGLDFSLAAGDALVLVGPNGSGKSSLLRLLAGFGRPVAGTIAWDGSDIHDDLEGFQAAIQFLGHADAVKPALHVAEQLGFWMALSGAPADPVALGRALEVVRLSHLAGTPCRFLSSGQRRRLALARLVAYRRPLWLLDEPSVGLDAASIHDFAAVIAEHREEGGIVLVSTHQNLGLEGAATLSLDAFPARADSEPDWWSA